MPIPEFPPSPADNHSVNARGLMSGILQQGYSCGYVFAACANLGVGGSTESWKTVFWIAGSLPGCSLKYSELEADKLTAGLSIGVGVVRIFFPESQQFLEAKRAGKKSAAPGAFWLETKQMLGQEWKMCIYCIILMTWVFVLANLQ